MKSQQLVKDDIIIFLQRYAVVDAVTKKGVTLKVFVTHKRLNATGIHYCGRAMQEVEEKA